MTPDVKISCVANLYTRMMHFKNAGDIEHGHKHQFDHMTLLAKGKLRVTANRQATEYTAPHMIYINKDVEHELVALTDNTVAYCVHALRFGENVEDIIDPETIPAGVNPQSMSKPLIR